MQVYGGFAGFFDYGPLGVELRANIKKAWWTDMVHRRDDIVGLDSSIIASPQVWRASGHVDGFSDPMVDCKVSKLRYRADQLFWARAEVDGELLGYVSLLETDDMQVCSTRALAHFQGCSVSALYWAPLSALLLPPRPYRTGARDGGGREAQTQGEAQREAQRDRRQGLHRGHGGGAAADPFSRYRRAWLAHRAQRVQSHVPDECRRDVGCLERGVPAARDCAGHLH